MCFVFLRPPQAQQISHYSALGIRTITRRNTCKDPARRAIIARLYFSYAEACLWFSDVFKAVADDLFECV